MKVGDLIAFRFSKHTDKWPAERTGILVALVTEKLPSGGIMVRWLSTDEEDFVANGNLEDRHWEVLNANR